MTSTIRVLVLSDETWLLTKLRVLLSAAADLQLVGEATTLQDAPLLCRTTQPHVVLVGGLKPLVVNLPKLIHQVRPQVKVIALLAAEESRSQALLNTDLAGCLIVHEINLALLDQIRAVMHGGRWISLAVVQNLLNPFPQQHQPALEMTQLSKREQKILALLARGCDNAQIATELHLADIPCAIMSRTSVKSWVWRARRSPLILNNNAPTGRVVIADP